VLGGNGDDTILGAAGSDRLAGDRGSDWIDGGTGDDYLWGDQGRDIFVFSNGYGDDMIMDFEDSDIIDLRGLTGVASYADLFDNHMFQMGDDVVIEVGSDTLTLKDVTLGELTVKHFAM
jgi:Ca2+-binding RTX toxin-like protein